VDSVELSGFVAAERISIGEMFDEGLQLSTELADRISYCVCRFSWKIGNRLQSQTASDVCPN
jgi:hypothetical protein